MTEHQPTTVAEMWQPPATCEDIRVRLQARLARPPATTSADLHALLAEGGSKAAFVDELLEVLEPDAPVFDGLRDVVEQVAARDPLLARTLRALCSEQGWGRERDPDFAWAEYGRLAESGCQLAEFFRSSAMLRLDVAPSHAVDSMRTLVGAGFGPAAAKLSTYIARMGDGREVVAILKQGAELGDAVSLFLLGRRYWSGQAVARDRWVAVEHLLRSADNHNAVAMTSIGEALEVGLPGMPSNTRAALPWFKAAADMGYADASCRAAWALWRIGSSEEAAPYAEASARSGSPSGKYLCGLMLEQGRGLPRDSAGALALYEEAAKGGSAPAMVAAGRMLLVSGPVSATRSRALAWFRKGALAGNAASMVELGNALLTDDGIGEDRAEGERWLREAVDLDNLAAMECLGDLLISRDGCQDDGATLLRQAADAGRSSAAVALCLHLWPRRADPRVAADIFRGLGRAAGRGHMNASFLLGLLHKEAIGTPRDDAAAFSLFLTAARAGHAQAMTEAGHCLAGGVGTSKDVIAGIDWLRKASSAGNLAASRKLATLLDQLSLEQEALAAFETAVAQSQADDDLVATAGAMLKSRCRTIPIAGGRLLTTLAAKGTVEVLRLAGETAIGSGLPGLGAGWLRQAAKLGDTQSAYVLAMAVRGGVVAARDVEEASHLLRSAADRGHELSRQVLKTRSARPLTTDRRFAKLDALEGLAPVKGKLRDVAYAVELDARRRAQGLRAGSPAPAHLAFLGNPGTGKTTVAREVGAIFKTVGRLAKGHVVEVKRADLVGQHIGETEHNTRAAFDRAMDGVLFVDEAYELSSDDSTRDFGHKALGVLLTEMENRRDRVVVVVAGYTDRMEGFFDSNPGLPSRIPADNRITFPDYEPAELLRIMDSLARMEGFRLTSEARQAAWTWCQGARKAVGKRFGNARDVRDLLWAGIKANMGRRLCSPGSRAADLSLVVSDDVPRLP